MEISPWICPPLGIDQNCHMAQDTHINETIFVGRMPKKDKRIFEFSCVLNERDGINHGFDARRSARQGKSPLSRELEDMPRVPEKARYPSGQRDHGPGFSDARRNGPGPQPPARISRTSSSSSFEVYPEVINLIQAETGQEIPDHAHPPHPVVPDAGHGRSRPTSTSSRTSASGPD